ncbi:uncharacterized protein LAESUDRAFT_765510 [Laetiporus sulphureus 93-53]|uniref:Uncharacterized protein n=1 Tax=Laetiporus sulphureus 93-53 TaxID=1314785 RepID=A0A165AQL7_9APHY|nr:uncharacterized protein LAESUDRAFT_765510 [Laetiporus sulphureus 93-53]KZS99460.1 hypothetical protein LAESUDRAFT_765510 [Laetiporus sulphureus 93-53]
MTAFNLNDNSGWIGLDAIYHQHRWPLPSAIDKDVALKAASLQMAYDKEQCKANWSTPVVLAEEKAASATARLKKESKEPVYGSPLSHAHANPLSLPINLITTCTFKRACIEDSKPEIEHFRMPPEELGATTSSKMKLLKGKKCVKGSAVTSSSKPATVDPSLATITAKHDELQTRLFAMMSQFDLLLQNSQKMSEDNHKFNIPSG